MQKRAPAFELFVSGKFYSHRESIKFKTHCIKAFAHEQLEKLLFVKIAYGVYDSG